MKYKHTAEDKFVDITSYTVVGLFALATIIPFLNIIAKAVSEEWAVVSGKVGLWPVGFQLETMQYVLTSSAFPKAFLVSLIITFAGTFISMFVMAMTAYPLSKKHLWGIKPVIVVFVFTMLFHGGMIPSYLLIKNIHLYNTLWAVILPGVINVFNLIIIKNYYESMPESIEESARIDGASNVRIFFRIIAPLSVPVYATITLFTMVAYWNNYMSPMLYINEPGLKPLQLYLRDLIVQQNEMQTADDLLNVTPEGVKAATIIAATVPILLVYPFLQKYFIKGIMVGSVKG